MKAAFKTLKGVLRSEIPSLEIGCPAQGDLNSAGSVTKSRAKSALDRPRQRLPRISPVLPDLRHRTDVCMQPCCTTEATSAHLKTRQPADRRRAVGEHESTIGSVGHSEQNYLGEAAKLRTSGVYILTHSKGRGADFYWITRILDYLKEPFDRHIRRCREGNDV